MSVLGFQRVKVDPGFWESELGRTLTPPSNTYRDKIETPLLNNGANYVVIHTTTETDTWYMFYEVVGTSIRLYLPTTIKTQELLLTEERNAYVRMLEFIIRQESARTDRFFVFCPTKIHAGLARILFFFILAPNDRYVIESESLCVFYTILENDEIEYRHKNDDYKNLRRSTKKEVFLERIDKYENEQVVRIIRRNKHHERLLRHWQKREWEAFEKVSDPDHADYIPGLADTEAEPTYKKTRDNQSWFNRVLKNIFLHPYSRDAFETGDFIAYTMVGDVPDLVITFDNLTLWDDSLLQNIPTLYINYTARTMLGMLYRQKNQIAEIPNSSNVFKSVLKFSKAEFEVDRLRIVHTTEGSTRMLTRDLSREGEAANLKNLRPTKTAATYLTKYFKMDMRICSGIGCINFATHAFATDTQQIHAFCGQECAAVHFRNKKK